MYWWALVLFFLVVPWHAYAQIQQPTPRSASDRPITLPGGVCDPDTAMTTIFPNGSIECSPFIPAANMAHMLTNRAEPFLPNVVNLGLLPPGILSTAVTGEIATLLTIPFPPGELVGTTASQTLSNKEYKPRDMPLSNTASVLTINLSTTDIAFATDLQQDVLFANPDGTSSEGRWLRLRLHSTLPRALAWGDKWSELAGVLLPLTTTGGSTDDDLLFQWSSSSGKLVLIYNTQLFRTLVPSGVVAGTYTCPQALTVDTFGKLTNVVDGTCGGGNGTAAGLLGDVQIMGPLGTLVADSGFLGHDLGSHETYGQSFRGGQGGAYLTLKDPNGNSGVLLADPLSTNRVWTLPNRSGPLALKASRGLVFQLGDETGAALLTTAVTYATVPFSCTLSAYALTINAADSTLKVKFWRVAGGTAKPASGNSINTAGVGVATGTHVKSTTMTDFTSTAIAADDTLAMAVATANTAKYVSATLYCDP